MVQLLLIQMMVFVMERCVRCLMNGKIIRIISNLYTVKIDDMLYGCRARGIFRQRGITPLVGDNVVIDSDNNLIVKILPRKNELKRPVIANVDNAIIVASVKKPNLDLLLLDKLIALVTYNDIEPIIVFTKLDLLTAEEKIEIDNLRSYYESIGYSVFYNNETARIIKCIKDKIVVLAGQSGAGKSTLINRLTSKYNIETREISEALGRGKHTTRHTELYDIDNALVADTPGFSSLDLSMIDKEELKDVFIEFRKYTCKYRDCLHNREDDCKVKKEVEKKEILLSRYSNYLKILEEIK